MHNVNMANNVTKQNAIKQLTLRISSETTAFVPAYAKSGGFRLRFAYNLSKCLRFCPAQALSAFAAQEEQR